MSNDSNKSAIKEVRDQLFLDTADGGRLTAVTDNLGWSRPIFGFGDDDEWRALSKQLALGPRQIEWSFRRILDICIGPDFARTASIAEAVEVGDTTITVEDASDLVQKGTVIIDEGTASEETIAFCFVDYATNKVFLETPTTFAHAVLADGNTVLANDVAATATSLVLADSSQLPTTGYPYTISLGKGTPNEEAVTVSNNDTATNTLTTSAVANDHKGFRAEYVRRELNAATVAGRVFLQFDINDTDELPESGWIRLDAGLAGEEIVFYDENDASAAILYLKTPLANAHAVGASVELLFPGVDVRTASLRQVGQQWEIYDTTHDHVKIRVPDTLTDLNIIDASWLHDSVPSTLATTTIAVAAAATDTVIELASVTNLPAAGMIEFAGTPAVFYTAVDAEAVPNPTITLADPIGTAYAPGTSANAFEVPYTGTLLEEGNPRDAGGTVLPFRYPGPYVFDPAERAAGVVSTTITSLHPPQTEIVENIAIGRETLQCADLLLWSLVSLPFQVRIGIGTGFEEDVTAVDVTLADDTTGSAVSSGGGLGTDTIVVDVSGATEPLPEIVGVNTASYKIIIDEGNANEETVTVVNETLVGSLQTLTIAGTFTIAHAAAETVRLVHDVLTVDPVTNPHTALTVSPTVEGHKAEYLTDTISLTSASGFGTDSGFLYVNFGRNRINHRTRLNTIVNPTTYQFDDTSRFPTTDFPYQIVLSEGTAIEESVFVTANNTGLNQLTFASAPVYTHSTGPAPFGGYAAFVTGGMELIEYQDVDGNDLILDPPQALEKHTVGELALESGELSIPRSDGYSYAFLLPPNKQVCIEEMFERVRAAGIQVTVTTF